MSEYPSNSNKSKDARNINDKKVKKVITGTAKTEQQKGVKKLMADLFMGDIQSVIHYAIYDVIHPTIKKTLHDILSDGLNIMFYGDVKQHGKNTSYGSYYRPDRNSEQQTNKRSMGYDELIFNSRTDAYAVLDELDGLIVTYGLASVADLYSAAGLSCDFTLQNYGWTDIKDAEIVRVEDGYKIKLPKAVSLRFNERR